jgi:hypothetical protein
MRKITKFFIFASIFFVLTMPVFSLMAQDTGLVPCTNNCGFKDLMALVNTVINFILYKMVIPIAAIMFAYAGFLMITAGGEAAGARTKAKNIFTNAVIGLAIAMAAFLIIKLLLTTLGWEGSWIGF